MEKKITLEMFERAEYCRLDDYQFFEVKKEIELTIKRMNEFMEKGYSYADAYIQMRNNELTGMLQVAVIVGINIEVKKERLY